MLRNPAAAVLAAACLGACSVTVDVIGKVGPDEAVYRGTATSDSDNGGTIEMAADGGRRCIGAYRYTGTRMGIGHLMCSDGRSAVIRFTALGLSSGYGYGYASDGSALRFAFGLSEKAAEPYLATAAGASAVKKPAGGTGTGFFVGPAGKILTNAHVVRACTSVTVRLPDGSRAQARVAARDAANDLALLQADVTAPAVATFNEAPAYRPGDVVVAYGFPLTRYLTDAGNLTTGNVTALSGMHDDSRFLQISTPVQSGNSGGPLVDERGNVVGVVTSKLDALGVAARAGDLPQNVNFAVKDVFARSFLEAHGVSPAFARGRPKLSTADLGSVLRSFAVHIECRPE